MFDANDPRWTAYILNELDPAESADCESLLATDPDASRAVAELRRTIDQLTIELQREPCPSLTSEQRATIAIEHPSPLTPHHSPWYMRHAWKLAGLAAAILIFAYGILPALRPAKWS